MFKVGDYVIGNEKADGYYSRTACGVVCEVIAIDENARRDKIRVKIRESDEENDIGDEYWVEPERFDPLQMNGDNDELDSLFSELN